MVKQIKVHSVGLMSVNISTVISGGSVQLAWKWYILLLLLSHQTPTPTQNNPHLPLATFPFRFLMFNFWQTVV